MSTRQTATEVVDRIDQEIEEMTRLAAGPCIDALVEWSDRDAYREAMRRGHGLKAVQTLRRVLAGEIEAAGDADAPKSKGRRGSRKRKPN